MQVILLVLSTCMVLAATTYVPENCDSETSSSTTEAQSASSSSSVSSSSTTEAQSASSSSSVSSSSTTEAQSASSSSSVSTSLTTEAQSASTSSSVSTSSSSSSYSSSQSTSSSSTTSSSNNGEENCCSDNEHYVNNESVCSRTCKNEVVVCDTITGCVCNDGFVKNDNGDCVDLCTCPSQQCGKDQIYSNCTRSKCHKTCSDFLSNRLCPRILVAIPCNLPGCVCKDDWLENSDGVCVPPSECVPETTCPPNETPTDCANECFTGTCKTRLRKPQACPLFCAKGCTCIDGYKRHDNNTCVPIDQCSPPNCNKNEEYKKCGTACEITCDNCENPPQVCTEQCVENCFCKKGFVRSSDGSCVKPKQCSGQQCGKDEIYSNCTKSKCHKTCSDLLSKRSCPRIDARVPCNSPGCVCKEDWLKNSDGICVPPCECGSTQQCGVNEEPTDCANPCLERSCKNRLKPNRPCPRSCVKGCKCKKNYYRHDNNTCVPLSECSPPYCNDDEEHSNCGSACPQTCKNYNNPSQICTLECVESCFCKKGTVRAEDGSCVDPKQCPPTSPPVQCCENEVFEQCKITCPPPTCQFYGENIQCFAPNDCSKGGCNCKEGYTRNGTLDDPCIPVNQCPKKPENCCGVNEEPSDCVTGCETTCKTRFRSDGKVCAQVCRNGCKCIQNYLRHDNGVCVPIDQCSEPICNADEERNRCGSACETTCDNYQETNRPCTRQCVDGCFCKKGTVRASDGSCVTTDQCPTPPEQQCPKNEVYTTCLPATCYKTCDDLKNHPPCPSIADCNQPGCVCKADYLRSEVGVCIPVQDCSPTSAPECGENEVYKECKVKCPPETCDLKDILAKCKPDIPCEPGCNCKPNYYRNGNSTAPCIPKEQCPSEPTPPTCGDNEIYVKNSTTCDRTCSTKDESNLCGYEYTGCKCIDGYFRDCYGKCIEKSCCPKPPTPNPCNKNENWSACRIICPPQTCFSIAALYNCIQPPPIEPGCDCRPTYLRNGTSTDICIPSDQCPGLPPIIDCGPNQIYVQDAEVCEKTCEDKDDSCATCQTTTGCVCQEGYVRDNQNECVDPCNCSPQCGKNEHFDNGPDPCPPRTCHARLERWDCRKFDNTPKPKCRCNDGYVRNDAGICILECEC